MPAERYYYEGPLLAGEQIQLSETEQHHLLQVMRTRIGEQVEIANGEGQLAAATLSTIGKKAATLQIDHVSLTPKPPYQLILAQALPKSNRLDWILEKGTELGMTEIWLFPGQYSEKQQLNPQQLARSKAITLAAMKQSGQTYLPKITLHSPIAAWEKPSLPLFYGDTAKNAPPFYERCNKQIYPNGLIFVVGPERGFSSGETEALKKLGAAGVKLNNFILRTETAAIIGLGLAAQLYFC